MQDFGAVVTIPTQDTMNQAIPARMLQCIIITVQYEKTVTLENGVSMKFNKTVDRHIWAATGGTLDSNYFFVFKCLREILKEYIIEGILVVKSLSLFNDGCAYQYKSRKIVLGYMKIAHEFDLDYILISFSATGDGKGIPDGSSGDGACAVRDLQYKEQIHANNAFEVFVHISNKMGTPAVTLNPLHRRLMAFTDRKHTFILIKSLECVLGWYIFYNCII